MNKKTTAAKLFLISQDHSKDIGLKLLEMLKELDLLDSKELIEEYYNLVHKRSKIAQVMSAKKLNEEQKSEIKAKITKMFGDNLIFIFQIDKSLIDGLKIVVDDNVIDQSIKSDLEELTL